MRPLIACLLIAPLLIGGCDKRSTSPEQANTHADAATPVLSGEASSAPAPKPGSIDRSHKGEAAPATSFQDAAGKPVTLAALRGKPVLLNLWATWCGPCVAEMPALEKLAARDGARLTVVAANQGEDAGKVAAFAAKTGLTTLKPYLDPKLALSLGYQVNLPTSILIDSHGREVWRVSGGMDWAGAAAAGLLAEAS